MWTKDSLLMTLFLTSIGQCSLSRKQRPPLDARWADAACSKTTANNSEEEIKFLSLAPASRPLTCADNIVPFKKEMSLCLTSKVLSLNNPGYIQCTLLFICRYACIRQGYLRICGNSAKTLNLGGLAGHKLYYSPWFILPYNLLPRKLFLGIHNTVVLLNISSCKVDRSSSIHACLCFNYRIFRCICAAEGLAEGCWKAFTKFL